MPIFKGFGRNRHQAASPEGTEGNDFVIPDVHKSSTPDPKPQPQPPDTLLPTSWRDLEWGQRDQSKDKLRKIKLSCPTVSKLRILVHGPVGAGKSSFTNSIDSIFQNRMTSQAAVEAATDHSFTRQLQVLNINDGHHESFLPFAFCDTMGLENAPLAGVATEDLVKVLQGHIRDGYWFSPTKSCSDKDQGYNSYPTLADRIHCMICVIPASIVSFMEDDVIKKMRNVRAKAADMRIPQVVVLTKIDLVCPEVAKDIKLVYRSKKIRQKMEECSNKLGVPMNCIFPVKNYSEEITLKSNFDVLLLSAFGFILNFANDHLAVAARAGADPRFSSINFSSPAPPAGGMGNRPGAGAAPRMGLARERTDDDDDDDDDDGLATAHAAFNYNSQASASVAPSAGDMENSSGNDKRQSVGLYPSIPGMMGTQEPPVAPPRLATERMDEAGLAREHISGNISGDGEATAEGGHFSQLNSSHSPSNPPPSSYRHAHHSPTNPTDRIDLGTASVPPEPELYEAQSDSGHIEPSTDSGNLPDSNHPHGSHSPFNPPPGNHPHGHHSPSNPPPRNYHHGHHSPTNPTDRHAPHAHHSPSNYPHGHHFTGNHPQGQHSPSFPPDRNYPHDHHSPSNYPHGRHFPGNRPLSNPPHRDDPHSNPLHRMQTPVNPIQLRPEFKNALTEVFRRKQNK